MQLVTALAFSLKMSTYYFQEGTEAGGGLFITASVCSPFFPRLTSLSP